MHCHQALLSESVGTRLTRPLFSTVHRGLYSLGLLHAPAHSLCIQYCYIQSIGNCKRLRVLDVSCNKLELFPSQLCDLKLKEFHYENNPLLPRIPVPAEQQEEVLQLKVISD